MPAGPGIQLKPGYKMIVKVHRTTEGRKIVAVCDSDLVGKKFEEGKMQLDLSSGFYKGEEISKDKVSKLIKEPGVFNVVGEKCVGLFLKLGLVDKGNVIRVDNVPHTQVVIGG